MIFIGGISIALFISALLLSKKNKSKSDYFLFLWMLLNAAHLSLFYLFYSEEIYNYPHFLGLQFPLPLLHGVLLYYYVSSVTNHFPAKKPIAVLHLFPTIAAYVFLIPFMLLSANEKIEIFKNGGKGYETFQSVLLIGIFLSGIVYVVWSAILLFKHKSRIQNEFSDLEEVSLSWLQFLTYGLGVVWTLVIITQNNTLIFAGVSVFVILIGFFGVQQKTIFSTDKPILSPANKTLEEKGAKGKNQEKDKYIKSGLAGELAESQFQNLARLMSENGYYKNSELSLRDLAVELETHPNHLSQIINEKGGKSFYDFVNAFRVDEFKRLIEIPDNQQYTLMALAYDCGFNSKSSFNRYFKKMTGQTPSQYNKSISEKRQ